MSYSTYGPGQRLKPFIEKISIQESEAEPVRSTTRIVPTGTIDLLFHYGEPFLHLQGQQEISKPYAYLAGQRTGSFDVAATGRTGIVIVNLKPWGLSAITHTPVSEFTNQFVDLTAIFPSREITILIDKLRDTPQHKRKAKQVEMFLVKHLADRTDRLVLDGVQKLYQTGSGKISDLTNNYGISKRQMDRRFRDTIGLTPKKLQTIIRFQRSLALLQTNLCRSAHDAGYFDQSHMNHDYQRFIGTTPTHVLSRVEATPLMKFYARSENMSRFYNHLHLQ